MSSTAHSVFSPRLHRSPAAFATLVLACCGLLLSSPSWGQASTSLRGTITDPSGSTVAGASVVLSNNESKVERAATTSEQGEYQFLFLPPGTYTLIVTASGFQRYELTGVQLLVNTPATINTQLKVGVATETVNVTSELPSAIRSEKTR
jgi:hypothetical protein